VEQENIMITEIKVDTSKSMAEQRGDMWNTTQAVQDMMNGLCKPTVSGGLYHKFVYKDGSMLVTSPWDSYVSNGCWCPSNWNMDKHGHTPACQQS
jgi:hypothetical protein